MAISRVEIKDYFVFKGELTVDFCDGVNVLIGGNGTGKTSLLRGLYGHVPIMDDVDSKISKLTIHLSHNIFTSTVKVTETSVGNNKLFISESNILSHARGLLETVKHGGLQYSIAEVFIIEQARVLPSKPKPEIVKRIEEIIGGAVELSTDGQSFIMNRSSLDKPIDLLHEASGYQKFALLARLIHNEQIKDGSIIFWDEPENSLNPELIRDLVDILLELADSGVQIFLATHDYNLARYFDVRKKRNVPVAFHNLTKFSDGQITVNSSPVYTDLPNNLLERANEDLFEAVVSSAMEDDNE